MAIASNLGFPRIGPKRELKKALESFWSGKSNEEELLAVAKTLRKNAWSLQLESGIKHIPSNDFSFYDHVLDTIAMVGAIPSRFGWNGKTVDLRTYFGMASGKSGVDSSGQKIASAQPMEMTKWFNTNYHFNVPELDENQTFKLASTKCVDQFKEAQALGILTRPVLLGPVSFLHLAKLSGDSDHHQSQSKNESTNKLIYKLDGVLEVYKEVVSLLKDAGATWIQFDEPCLALDLDDTTTAAYTRAYESISSSAQDVSILLATYFGKLGSHLEVALNLPVQGIHLDLTTGSSDVEKAISNMPSTMKLSAGVVDGRNIWKSNLSQTLDRLEAIAEKIGTERLIVAPSCSLMHTPVDLDIEKKMDPDVRSWLSFAKQKLTEISVLTRAINGDKAGVQEVLQSNKRDCEGRASSPRTNNAAVKKRVADVEESMFDRKSAYPLRKTLQHKKFAQPLLPTTTIGSFPQTKEIRTARKDFRAGRTTLEQYEQSMRDEIVKNILIQEELGIDVFVHGEPERTDMVEYFAEQLQGITISEYGWVQSYGSRCVKPPIVHSDIVRTKPMSLEWSVFAQAQTGKPVKGMLTGPVTMLQWSFIRDDQPRKDTCTQLALVIRDEVKDLESAGIKIIQIDEPAIREGLPLRHEDWAYYLDWSVKCFRLSASGVDDDTQIHTHMCYSEFDEILQAIIDMDADVISIEAARSRMELLQTIKEQGYPNEIGPGVYDIHSPKIANLDEVRTLLRKALQTIPADRLWINPDCGLKTRTWDEVLPSLHALTEVASELREEVSLSLASGKA